MRTRMCESAHTKKNLKRRKRKKKVDVDRNATQCNAMQRTMKKISLKKSQTPN